MTIKGSTVALAVGAGFSALLWSGALLPDKAGDLLTQAQAIRGRPMTPLRDARRGGPWPRVPPSAPPIMHRRARGSWMPMGGFTTGAHDCARAARLQRRPCLGT